MKRIKFECKLLSDVVLKSSSATEGFIDNLDYIPGAKFLGIAAGLLYDEKQIGKTLDLFHNGDTRFGDAHIALDGIRTSKVPASWFFKKGEGVGDEKYLHHKLSKEMKQDLSSKGIQLKQARKGYFVSNKYTVLENNFSIKSAYDSSARKAKDSQMYGYYALPKGSSWIFYVDTKEEYSKEIINALEGRKRIGRSRSAEYGLVEIKRNSEQTAFDNVVINAGEVIIYADSNLCFYDNYGQNTLQPDVSELGLPEGSKILWDKSQVRTRKYQTWNNKRYNRDADRMIIEKGSVIVVNTIAEVNTSDFENGIGAHRNEGFGNIIINPTFLSSKSERIDLKLEKYEIENPELKYFIENGGKDELLKTFLKAKQEEKRRILTVDKMVNEFTKNNLSKFGGITPSQWGQVRNYAKHAANEKVLIDLLFRSEFGYFMHGQSEHKWRAGNKRIILKDYLEKNVPTGSRIEFIQKLASEMGKNSIKSKN